MIIIEWIGWQQWNEAGDRPGKISKAHAFADGATTALCGTPVSQDAMDYGTDLGDGQCKRCRKADEELESQGAFDSDEFSAIDTEWQS